VRATKMLWRGDEGTVEWKSLNTSDLYYLYFLVVKKFTSFPDSGVIWGEESWAFYGLVLGLHIVAYR